MITCIMDKAQSGQSQNIFQVEEIGEDSPVQNKQEEKPEETPAVGQGIELSPEFNVSDSNLGDNLPTEGGKGVGKIVLILFFLIIIALVGFFGYRLIKGKAIISNKPVTLTYWGLWEDEAIMQPIIAEYQSQNPNVTINYTLQTPKQYRERVEAAVSRGEVDIFRFHNTWVPMLKEELAPLPNSIISNKEYEETFYPVAQNDLKIGSNYVGLPLMIDGLALYYNEDMLKAVGASVPRDWDSFLETATLLTTPQIKNGIKTSDIEVAGAALGTANNIEHFSDILALMFLQNGADLSNPVGTEASGALTYYRFFAEKPGNTWDEKQENSIIAFAQGKVAMIFAPSWQAFNIMAKNPKLNFKTAPVPQLPDTRITWASYWAEGVSSTSKQQKEAWEFLKYLSSKETLVKLFNQQSQTRPFGEAYSRTDLAQSLTNHPILAAYILQAPEAKSFPLASNTQDNGLNDRLIKYLEDAVNSLSAGGSADQALDTAASGFQQVLSQYGVIGGSSFSK